MDQKIGVYICSGCGIGESIDVEALSAVANEFKIAKCLDHPVMCGEEGAGLIRADLESGDTNCAVIAACSGRVKTDVFSFDPMTTIVERVNIREHVAWCQPPGHEDTQMMAEDYLRMGIIKVEKSTLPKPYLEAIDKTVLVIGGGAAGLQASLDAAQAGYSVTLVEKEPELGGHMAKWHKNTPTAPPYQEIEEITIQQTIDQVRAHSDIKIHTGDIHSEDFRRAGNVRCDSNQRRNPAHRLDCAGGRLEAVRPDETRTFELRQISRCHYQCSNGRNGKGRQNNLSLRRVRAFRSCFYSMRRFQRS